MNKHLGASAALIIDDEPDIRELMESHLRKFGFFSRIDHAKNGKEALGLLQECRYSHVFCDLDMPVMDGSTLLAEVQKRNLTGPRFIIITGTALEQLSPDKQSLIREATDGCLKKPFSRQQLAACIKFD